MSQVCVRAGDGLTMLGVAIPLCDGELVTSVYPSGAEVVACEWHTSLIEEGF